MTIRRKVISLDAVEPAYVWAPGIARLSRWQAAVAVQAAKNVAGADLLIWIKVASHSH
jgi:hypothetical protein